MSGEARHGGENRRIHGRPTPGDAELCDIRLVDLVEGRIARGRAVATIRAPLAVARLSVRCGGCEHAEERERANS